MFLIMFAAEDCVHFTTFSAVLPKPGLLLAALAVPPIAADSAVYVSCVCPGQQLRQ